MVLNRVRSNISYTIVVLVNINGSKRRRMLGNCTGRTKPARG